MKSTSFIKAALSVPAQSFISSRGSKRAHARVFCGAFIGNLALLAAIAVLATPALAIQQASSLNKASASSVSGASQGATLNGHVAESSDGWEPAPMPNDGIERSGSASSVAMSCEELRYAVSQNALTVVTTSHGEREVAQSNRVTCGATRAAAPAYFSTHDQAICQAGFECAAPSSWPGVGPGSTRRPYNDGWHDRFDDDWHSTANAPFSGAP